MRTSVQAFQPSFSWNLKLSIHARAYIEHVLFRITTCALISYYNSLSFMTLSNLPSFINNAYHGIVFILTIKTWLKGQKSTFATSAVFIQWNYYGRNYEADFFIKRIAHIYNYTYIFTLYTVLPSYAHIIIKILYVKGNQLL